MKFKMYKKFLLIPVAIVWSCIFVHSQDIVVRSGFMADSLRVGDEVSYYVTARYPTQFNLVFSDSSFNYAPFEFKGKSYSPTNTLNKISYDSVVYHLTTFEVDSIQFLRLPVFKLNARDCTQYYSTYDTIAVKQTVKSLPDTITAALPIKETVAYQAVTREVNYKVIAIILMALLIVASLVWFLFGDELKRYLRIKRMRKMYRNFITTFTQEVNTLNENYSPDKTAHAVTIWKKYMEQLSSRPYTKLTTRETILVENNEALGKDLRLLDSAIYGHNTNVASSLEKLKRYAHERYHQRLKEIKHA